MEKTKFLKNKSLALFLLAMATLFFSKNICHAAWGDISQTFIVSNATTAGDFGYRVISDSSGNLYVGGQKYSGGVGKIRIEKRDTAGNLLWQNVFAVPGAVQSDFRDMIYDGSDLYLAGSAFLASNPGPVYWYMAKLQISNGNIIWQQTENVGGAGGIPRALTENSSYFYVSGHDSNASGEPFSPMQWRIEKRKKSDGSLFTSGFNAPSGYINVNPSIGHMCTGESAFGIVADSSGVYVAGKNFKSSNCYNTQIDVRKFNSDGSSTVWNKLINPTNDNDDPVSLTLNGGDLYVLGSQGLNINAHIFPKYAVYKLDKNNGAVDPGFNFIASSNGYSLGNLFVDPTGIYLTGVDNASTRGIVEVIDQNTGIVKQYRDYVSFIFKGVGVNGNTFWTVGGKKNSVSGYEWTVNKHAQTMNSDNATFVRYEDPAQVIPNTTNPPTTVAANGTFTASIVMQNTGTTTWDNTYSLKNIAATTWNTATINLPAGTTVAPGAFATFTATFTAPATAGTYPFQWQLQKAGTVFGTVSTLFNITVDPCTIKTFSVATSSFVPSAAFTNSQFNVYCDYADPTINAAAVSVTTIPSTTCPNQGLSGTKVVFQCTTPATPANIQNITCNLSGVTAEKYCARTDALSGNINVTTCVEANPSCAQSTCSGGTCTGVCGTLAGTKSCSNSGKGKWIEVAP